MIHSPEATTGLHEALARVRAYVEHERFLGYDPYDALNTPLPLAALGKWPPILAIQILKRMPWNPRPLLGIRKGHNPKGMGLFLHAYALLYEYEGNNDSEARSTARWLFEWLYESRTPGYSGDCWGYNFDWASPVKYLSAYTPSIVVTAFVGKGLLAYYRVTGDERALATARSACTFILEDLPVTRTAEGICFSYTPIGRDCCYNASMLGAELLAGVYAATGEDRLLEAATQAVDFVVARQHSDGHWKYSVEPTTGIERNQVDFHQGFVLESLLGFLQDTDLRHEAAAAAVHRGAEFYRSRQFAPDGRARWRLPREWPADIHHQAQGIITFAKLAERDPTYRETAHRIAEWTIRNMQDDGGFFYYRKGRVWVNRVPYMRWGQAWMLLALAALRSSVGHPDEVLTP